MRKLVVAIVCLAISAAGCTGEIRESTAQLPVRIGGQQMLTMTTPRALHAAVALHDGRILISGGTSTANVGGVLDSAEIYDPAVGTFEPTGTMTAARQGHTATVLPDGRVLLTGGTKNIGFRATLASAEIYDPGSGTFQTTGSMTTAREGHTATLLRDGRVLIAGGSPNGTSTTASAEVYDPRSGKFRAISPMGVPREAHSATLMKDGRVLIAGGGRGGMPGGYIAYDTAEIFNPATNSFHTVSAHMKVDRVGPAAALLDDGRVLIAGGKSGQIRNPFGGGNLASFTPLASAETFDPETRSFVALPRMHATHYLGVATRLDNGTILITGGWTAIGGMIGGERVTDLFEPERNIFAGGELHVGRLEQTATLLRDGDVLVAGGLDRQGNVTATVEFYAPRAGEFVRTPSTSRPQLSE